MTSTLSPQFGTLAQVTVIPPFGDGVIVNPDLSAGKQQLRVDWSVTKGVGQGATASVRAYNLKADSRNRIASQTRRIVDFSDELDLTLDGRIIQGFDLGGQSTVSSSNGFGTLKIHAKYQGSATTANLFEGTATQTISRLARHTWVTNITGGDGAIQDSAAIADKFWGSTVPATEVVDYLVRRVMVAELATTLPAAISAYSFVGGYDATNFYASDILDQLTALTRTEWWWDDGAVYFGDIGQPLPGAVLTFSPNSVPGVKRLLERPRPTDGGDPEIVVLLTPELRPKTPVTLVSSDYAGSYYATTVTHNGSNRAGVSKTTAQLRRVGELGFL